ncbi:MAG: hypothetical protein VW125_08455 [Flavobacteriaceae bacterium]|jgi:type IV secretory pathway TrbF-like protein
MSRDFLYYRAILKKVSFDPELFKKELLKAYRFLGSHDRLALKDWVKSYVANNHALKLIVFSDPEGFILG